MSYSVFPLVTAAAPAVPLSALSQPLCTYTFLYQPPQSFLSLQGEQCNIVPDNIDDIVADLAPEEKEEGTF